MLTLYSPFNATLSDLIISALLVAVLAGAVYTDLRWGRIYNKLTFGAAGAGLILNTLAYGFDGLLLSVEGWLLGAGLFIIFFVLGVMGAGDVKLLAAVGALKGPFFVFNAFLFTALAGGLVAIFVMLRRRRAKELLGSMSTQLQYLFFLRQAGPIDKASSRFPYGVAIAIGSLVALFLRLGL
jgi:prepilin peptidase CpaA